MKPSKTLLKSIDAYYRTLKEFDHQRAFHEGAVSVAFQTLLSDTARSHGWTLIPQLSDKQSGAGIRPDGTLKDQMNLVRGHWEAKDTSDNLDVEIIKKTKTGYPLNNIIFEDTRTAILIQNKNEVMRADLKDPEHVARLLDQFFGYIEPQIEGFEQAVNEFKTRVPELAKALKEKVIDAHLGNKPFKEAFGRFFELCKTSLNPNIAKDAVDDMLVQHLLTERLIREIFDNPEFTRRNVIASEIEKVIEALTSKSFNRDVFLKSLDRFYIAIENAARTITDWSDKQHFLNTIYERFFQGYSVKLADTMGIVYTPQPIVDFMCASVAEVLENEFGKTLGSPDVNILDPCTGTGNFIVNLMKRIPKRDLPRVYKSQMFANEIMLLPYYIAAMNIEHAYYEITGGYEAFEGLCFVDTLDLVESHTPQFSFMTPRNTERVERQMGAPITVIIGNPPYNVGQNVHNEQNQNRGYLAVDHRIKNTYGRDSAATSVSKLSDAYVKFFRWACDRLGDRNGVVCFVSNNAFVSQFAFDGMRKHLQQDFARIFHLDLEGSVRENPGLSGTQYNVFGIQVGVGITVAIKKRGVKLRAVDYINVDKTLRREQKLATVSSFGSASNIRWKKLKPDEKHTWLVPANGSAFLRFIPIATKAARASKDRDVPTIFRDYSLGIA
ncbi:MAG TPA: N-6 DNA methylase, partial [Humisphaera sp.]|nr:N-6 DNA methylase [Humisphaera sp.]